MISQKPKITVCIPTFNRKDFLRKTLDSVIKQTYKNIEILVSDDCSTTSLDELIKSVNDERILFFRQKQNIGFVKNWNFCVNNSSGEYIKILGDDDILNEDCIEQELKIILENKIDFVCSNYDTIDEFGVSIKNKNFNNNSFRLAEKSREVGENEFIKKYFLGQIRAGLPSAIIFKKELIHKTGLFEEKMGCAADIDMWMKMISTGKLYYNDNVLLKMRRHSDNLSSKLNKNFFSCKEDLDILFDNYKKIKKINFIEKFIIFFRYMKMLFKVLIDRRFLQYDNKNNIFIYFFNLHKIFI